MFLQLIGFALCYIYQQLIEDLTEVTLLSDKMCLQENDFDIPHFILKQFVISMCLCCVSQLNLVCIMTMIYNGFSKCMVGVVCIGLALLSIPTLIQVNSVTYLQQASFVCDKGAVLLDQETTEKYIEMI